MFNNSFKHTGIELNMDGLVGPTHNYSGLSFGNKAATANEGRISNPRAAAIQGLAKMELLVSLGIPQTVLPPQDLPRINFLRRLGFAGTDQAILEAAFNFDPAVLAIASSASAMWAANAATVSPSVDCADNKVHFVPANLRAMPHRSLEPPTTYRLLQKIFPDADSFCVHQPLPAIELFADEGAANHNRLASSHGHPGLAVFVYGRNATDQRSEVGKLPRRQTLQASQAIAKLHRLPAERCLYLRQSPSAIDAGAFHNDVVCVTNGPVMLHHEYAFDAPEQTRASLFELGQTLELPLQIITASESEMPLADAVRSYFFNSQLITRPDGGMTLILPSDAEEVPTACRFAEKCLTEDSPIDQIHYLDLRQSMRNGGGPACLRLRVPLTATELARVHQPALLNQQGIEQLKAWVNKHYRDRLHPSDLKDPALLIESRTALDELTAMLELGSVYEFQAQ